MENSKRTPNRLVHEKSPYLLQHADNPVRWFPWSPEAFQKAQKENKPVFLSIGYSTCHWCHVMEKESFQDEELAGMMNETFVPIKVDREERPDIDSVYMDVCQVITGSGGWPLTIIMTPEKKPFFAATYIPKESRLGMMGLKELISRIKKMWKMNQDEIRRSSHQIVSSLKEMTQKAPGEGLGKETLEKTFQELAKRYDPKHGGFGKAPKFPAPHNLLFLLRYWKRTQNNQALAMVERTLQTMRWGGIFDHIGYGFHRYSTDERWLVPHFEKMLYDQALLAFAYTEAHQATGKKTYRHTAEEVLEYVLRDMKSPEGGFYSAEDADTEGEEGKFYTWSWKELTEVLNGEEMEWVSRVFDIYKEGNFPQQTGAKESGKNILYLKKSLKETAGEGNVKPEELKKKMEKVRTKLFKARKERVHPLKDDKILTDWNGLMIAALSKAAQVFEKSEYLHAARDAADFLLDRLWCGKGELYHRYRKGEAKIPGFLDDYAFLIWGLLELYEASLEASYLQKALKLNHYLLSHFWDEKEGGFGLTSSHQESFFIRPKNIYDGAFPSGNSVAVVNLFRLARMTANPDFEENASCLIRSFSQTVSSSPSAFTYLMIGVDFALGPSYEVVVTGKPGAEDTKEMLEPLRKEFLPKKVVLFRPSDEEKPLICDLAPFVQKQKPLKRKATVYVCRNQSCRQPTDDPDQMLQSLGVSGNRNKKT